MVIELASSVGSSEAEINAIRGMGDEFALRLRHHSDEPIPDMLLRRSCSRDVQAIEDARIASLEPCVWKGLPRI